VNQQMAFLSLTRLWIGAPTLECQQQDLNFLHV